METAENVAVRNSTFGFNDHNTIINIPLFHHSLTINEPFSAGLSGSQTHV